MGKEIDVEQRSNIEMQFMKYYYYYSIPSLPIGYPARLFDTSTPHGVILIPKEVPSLLVYEIGL